MQHRIDSHRNCPERPAATAEVRTWPLMGVWLLLLALLCGSLPGCAGQSGSDGRPSRRVLLIGNSYTASGGLPWVVEEMINRGQVPYKVTVDAVTQNSADWEQIFQETRAPQAIADGRYDMVILQNHSWAPLDDRRSQMVADARRFHRLVVAGGGRTYLFCTWARRHMPEAQGEITAAYCRVADELGAVLIPIGPAWAAVRAETPSPDLFSGDGSHPSPEGVYLTASVIYAVLTGQSPVGNPHRLIFRERRPVPIDAETARELQAAAWETVQGFRNACGIQILRR